MPLNKAQLMEVPGGPGITGAVKSGNGIIISGDGTISVNPATNVTQLIAGTNITLSPSGFGVVTIAAGGSEVVYFPTQRSLNNATVTLGGPLGQGAQTQPYGTQNFTIPAGANAILTSFRMSAVTFGNGSNASQGATIYGEGLAISSTFSGVGGGPLSVAVSSNFAAFSAIGLSRNQAQFLVRSDLVALNTTAGGTLTISTNVQQVQSIWADTVFQNLQIIITPIKQ